MTKNDFFDLALSLPETEKHPHFERTGFRIIRKRMYATYLERDHSANIFLTPDEQSVFCEMHEDIFPVPNKWGEKGATTFLLQKIPEEMVAEALYSAYNSILEPKK